MLVLEFTIERNDRIKKSLISNSSIIISKALFTGLACFAGLA